MRRMSWMTQRLLLPLTFALVIAPAGATETLDQSQIQSLTAGDYTYTLTHKGIVDVTCPPGAGAAGRR